MWRNHRLLVQSRLRYRHKLSAEHLSLLLPTPPTATATANRAGLRMRYFSSRIDSDHPRGKKEPYQKPKSRAQSIFRELLTSLQSLEITLDQLPPLPPIWSSPAIPNKETAAERHAIFTKTRRIVQEFEKQVRDGHIHPNGKQRHQVARLMEKIFHLYSQVANEEETEPSVLKECQRLIRLMQVEWQMELTDQHCESAVLVAAREQKWREAAEIYRSHIDPGDSGYIPCDVSAINPVGLYAIARDAQERGAPVVDNVFDAVLQLSMVSSSDQENYVLAAGRAIGHVGEWEQLIEYLQTSYSAHQFGQPLAAATMEACVLCGRYEEALDLFDEISGGHILADEWQWGGGQDRLHPLCRDLALRAMGEAARTDDSDSAMKLFGAIQESGAGFITPQALYGILSTFENEGKWEEAVRFFMSLNLELPQTGLTIVQVEDVYSFLNNSYDHSLESNKVQHGMDLLLLPVMRACIACEQYGVALFCQQVVVSSSPESMVLPHEIQHGRHPLIAHTALPAMADSAYRDELIGATMISLAGLQCFDQASIIYESMEDALRSREDMAQETRTLYDWICTESPKHVQDSFDHGLNSVLLQLFQVMAACSRARSLQEAPSPAEADLLSSSVSSCVQSCISVSQPMMGIIVGSWVESSLAQLEGINTYPGLYNQGQSAVRVTDSYLAAALSAFASSDRKDRALELVESHFIGSFAQNNAKWMLSCNATIRLLFEIGHTKEAMSLFRDAIATRRNPDTFIVAAKGLADNGEWQGTSEVYRLALTSGCLSEELSLLAMKSVVSGRTEGNIRVLRNIVDEISRHAGTSPETWVESKYWNLKRQLGFYAARSLMRWQDAKTAHLDELQLAIRLFEMRISRGLTPKFDSIRAIVSAVRGFDEGYVPSYRADLQNVPHDAATWLDLFLRILRETESTALANNADFVTDVAVGLHHLGYEHECAEYVQNAVVRGVQVRKVALNTAIKASQHSEAQHAADLEALTIN